MSEQMRSEFEAWRIDKLRGGDDRLKKCSNAQDVYYYTAEQEAWITWQASRAALCVELPVIHRDGDEGYNNAISHCRDAIHAAGVKTN